MTSAVWNEHVAVGYDEASAAMYAPEVLQPVVDFLAGLAPAGRVLEFAIGTGRVALPLSARGLAVSGIDSSQPMVEVMRTKPASSDVEVVIGDMATTLVPGAFDLVYVVYNAITLPLTQAEQVACFRNAARHLRPGGHFVVEVWVPDLQRLPAGETAQPSYVGEDRLIFDTYDLVRQHLVSHHYRIEDGTVDIFHSPHRFVWPSELDLMGELAGLELLERWADWKRSTFTAQSRSHVSVWVKPG